MSDNKGLTVAVLTGANAPNRTVLADGPESQLAEAEIVAQSAAAQPGSARPDGVRPGDAPLPPEGGERCVQPQQRESVRGATAQQLAKTNPVVGARR